jgi:hypothetical protein
MPHEALSTEILRGTLNINILQIINSLGFGVCFR